jgi:type III pantothenate kinase
MIIDIDAGNTRYKCRQAGELIVFDSMDPLLKYLQSVPNIERIRIASVKDSKLSDEIIRKCHLEEDKIFIAKTLPSNSGLTLCYKSPKSLGVDRWLAMLAAINIAPKGCVVIDAGSALTIDIVNESKVHVGGYIVPGLQMMRNSLFANTDKVVFDKKIKNQSLKLGDSTQSCVDNGVLLTLVSFIDRVIHKYPNYSVVVSGGDADSIVKLISKPCEHVGELVLDGLFLADNGVSF